MSNIGILGGTFDPLHNGHLKIAEASRTLAALDTVLFIPSFIPPHRDLPVASDVDRLAMVTLAIQDLPYAEISTLEIDRRGPSYMIDTLTSLAQSDPGSELFLILGADAMELFHTWKRPLDILAIAHIIVASRPGYDLTIIEKMMASEPFVKFQNKVQCMPCDSLDISSTELRARLKKRLDCSTLVPGTVLQYIEKNRLYL